MDDDPRYSHPDFGTREEDWPDPDVDSDTEEGRETMRLLEAASLATIDRTIAQRNQHPEYPAIPETLYEKARDHQDQLTDEERRLLLSRGDLVGKALASPDSLTADEIHKLLHWPPPSVVCANIQRATGGTLSTPTELYAKAKDAIDRGQLGAMLNEDEISLPTRLFHATESTKLMGMVMAAYHMPGHGHANTLLHRRLGLDGVVFQECAGYTIDQRRVKAAMESKFSGFTTDMGALLGQYKQGSVPDQDAIALNGKLLKVLQGTGARDPVAKAANEQMIRSMTSLLEQHQLGNITVQEVMMRIGDCFVPFKADTVPLPGPDPYIDRLWSDHFKARKEPHQLGKIAAQEAVVRPEDSTVSPKAESAPPPALDAVAERLRSDGVGSGSARWPLTTRPEYPIDMFARTSNLSPGDALTAWVSLPEDQKEAFRAQSETARRAAWVAHEARQAEPAAHDSPAHKEKGPDLRYPYNVGVPGVPQERMPGLPLPPDMMTGLRLFQNELGQDVEFEEALAKWYALPDEQKMQYDARARVLHKAAMAEYWTVRRNFFNNRK